MCCDLEDLPDVSHTIVLRLLCFESSIPSSAIGPALIGLGLELMGVEMGFSFRSFCHVSDIN